LAEAKLRAADKTCSSVSALHGPAIQNARLFFSSKKGLNSCDIAKLR